MDKSKPVLVIHNALQRYLDDKKSIKCIFDYLKRSILRHEDTPYFVILFNSAS